MGYSLFQVECSHRMQNQKKLLNVVYSVVYNLIARIFDLMEQNAFNISLENTICCLLMLLGILSDSLPMASVLQLYKYTPTCEHVPISSPGVVYFSFFS